MENFWVLFIGGSTLLLFWMVVAFAKGYQYGKEDANEQKLGPTGF